MRFVLAASSIFIVSLLVFTALSSEYIPHTLFAAQVETPHTTILFGGDMMFDRSVRQVINARGGDFIFSCLDPILRQSDMIVANLEGPITDSDSISLGSTPGDSNNFTFTFPPSTATLLYTHGIRIVNLGNNHIENFGLSGVRSTIAALTDASVSYFGDPINHTVASGAFNHIKIAYIGFNQFESPSATSTDQITIANIEKSRADGYLPVVYVHWGEEYSAANQYQKNLARRFIDAGAEIVIGSHPHVIEEHEQYKGKYIYYSLGNLIFDQYWDDSVRTGLMLSVTFTSNGVESIREIPVQLEFDRRTCPKL